MEGKYIAEEAELVLRLGLLCSHRRLEARPSMRHLVQYLSGDTTMMDYTLESAAIAILGMGDQEMTHSTRFFPSSFKKGSTQSLPFTNSILSTDR